MSQYSYIGLIYNPKSTGSSKKNAQHLTRQLRNRMPEQKMETVATKYAGHAEEIAYQWAIQYKSPLIISCSGDGGYSEVINGAMRAKHKGQGSICAVLPSGNANDHGHELHHTPLLEAIIKNEINYIDLLKSETVHENQKVVHYAHSYIGLGLTPAICAELNRHSLNPIKEIIIIWRVVFNYRPFEIIRNKRTIVYDSLIFTNISRMAKVFKVAGSNVRDGKFEVNYFTHSSKIILFGRLVKAALHRSKPQAQLDRYLFTTKDTMSIQYDGEVLPIESHSQVTISIAKKALATLL